MFFIPEPTPTTFIISQLALVFIADYDAAIMIFVVRILVVPLAS